MGGGGMALMIKTKTEQKRIVKCTECDQTAYATFFNVRIRSISARRKAPAYFCPSCGILFVSASIKVRRKK